MNDVVQSNLELKYEPAGFAELSRRLSAATPTDGSRQKSFRSRRDRARSDSIRAATGSEIDNRFFRALPVVSLRSTTGYDLSSLTGWNAAFTLRPQPCRIKSQTASRKFLPRSGLPEPVIDAD